MPALFNEIGVKCVTAALVESVDVTKQLEHKVIRKSDGGFEAGHRYDPTFSFTVKGRGAVDESELGGDATAFLPDQIGNTGTTIITSVKNSETNEDFNSFEVSGVGYPGAI